MRKTEETSRSESCLNRAKDHELVFVLLGRDAAAAFAIRAWAVQRVHTGKNKIDDPEIVEALNCAAQMEAERTLGMYSK